MADFERLDAARTQHRFDIHQELSGKCQTGEDRAAKQAGFDRPNRCCEHTLRAKKLVLDPSINQLGPSAHRNDRKHKDAGQMKDQADRRGGERPVLFQPADQQIGAGHPPGHQRVGDLQKHDRHNRVGDNLAHPLDRRIEECPAENIGANQHHQRKYPNRGGTAHKTGE